MKRYSLLIVLTTVSMFTYATIRRINNAQDFSAHIRNADIAIVEFYNPYCSACQRIEMPYRRLSEKYPHVYFYQISSETSEPLFMQHNITQTPTFHVYKNGRKIDTIVGARIKDVEQTIINNK